MVDPKTLSSAEKAGALKVLDDSLAPIATAEIVAGNRSRYEIQRAIKVGAHPHGAESSASPRQQASRAACRAPYLMAAASG